MVLALGPTCWRGSSASTELEMTVLSLPLNATTANRLVGGAPNCLDLIRVSW